MTVATLPFFSIVIPVYNDEKTIACAIDSVLSQVNQDFEIVLVDDGSTDGSLGVMRSREKSDSRVRVIAHDCNKGAYQARKTGVFHSVGKRILFLDGDDLLVSGSLTRLDQLITERPVDILHFAIKVIADGSVDLPQAHGHETWLMPYHGLFSNSRVLEACLLDELYCWNLCGKLFEGELCRRAFTYCGEGSFSRAEDMAAYLMCAYFARSYRGAPSEFLYQYHYGAGGDGSSISTVEQFEEKWLSYPDLIEELRGFFAEHSAEKDIVNVYTTKVSEILLRDTAESLVGSIPQNLLSGAIDSTITAWGAEYLVPQLALRLWEDQGRVAKDASTAKLFDVLVPTPKVVAVYYSRFDSDAEVDAAVCLVQSWQERGCSVSLLVDERLSDRYAEAFSGVVVTVIQPKFGISSGVMKLRFQALEFILQRDSIDMIVYGQWFSHALVWDVQFFKYKKIPTIVHLSSGFARPLTGLRSYFSTQPYVLALCDGFTFSEDSSRIFMVDGCPSRSQLIFARFLAMTFRKTTAVIPEAMSRPLINLLKQSTSSYAEKRNRS